MAKRRRRGRPPGPSSRRKAIVADLSARIAGGEWPVGKPIPSCRQLAARYRVSVTTLRLALDELKREGRLQVQPRKKPVAALGQDLGEMLAGAVAMVLKDQVAHYLRGAENQRLWQGLTESLLASNSPFLLLQHWKLWRTAFPAGLRELPLAGVLLLGPYRAETVRMYESLSVPVVLVDQPGAPYRVHSVSVANREAAYDATQRVLDLGHKRIAYVRSLVSSVQGIDPDGKERQEGFLAACRDRKLKPRQYRVFTAALTPASQTVREIAEATPRYTVIVCANGRHALQSAAAAEALGLRIPRDLSVVAFRPEHSEAGHVSGPVVASHAIGAKAVEIMLRKPAEPEHALVPAAWNKGETLAPPRAG
ncbi:MAG: substrate-binding domain-containing protein [Planctomycetota bacterium]|nr:substrate-binding domain-containing protein [Planctomycetota bacterium]